MFSQLGYVSLLGLPHVILWTPIVIFLWGQRKRPDIPPPARVIMLMVMAVMSVSLIFDYFDVARYLIGERAAF